MARVALITGVTGQDGGYLAEQLVARGDEVHGVVRAGEVLSEALEPLRAQLHLHEADLLDAERVSGLVGECSPDEVYNLAGISSVAQSWSEPAMTALVNGVAVAIQLEAAHAHQERTGRRIRFVQASSAEIFGGTTVVPQNEDTPLAPTSPYGASKAFAHHLVQVFRARGLHGSNAIFYNHESPRRPGTFVTRKITKTAAALARGEVDEIVLGNLDARRDWGWAPDYVDALIRIAGHDAGGDYVIATGRSHSVRDFVVAALAHVGVSDWESVVRSDAAHERPSDAAELVGDASRAQRVLGWAPTVSFEQVVARMVDNDLR